MIEISQIQKDAPVQLPCWDRASPPDMAMLWCSKGHVAVIGPGTGHTIASDGTVTPSCVCPRDGCGFHEHVKLIDW
jgi:hypothetical protein